MTISGTVAQTKLWGAIQSRSDPGVTSGVRRDGGEIYFLLVKINAYFGGLSNWGEVTSRWRDLLKGPVSTMVL